MRTHRITDEEVSAVLQGQTPAARDDLAAVADAVMEFRRASIEAPPQPSAELALRLDLERATRISAPAPGVNASTVVKTPVNQASTPRTRRRSVALSGFVGLGLAAKIAIGAGAAAAVGVTGTGAAGAAGVLPTEAQVVFNQVIGVEVDGENVGETVESGTKAAEEARLKAEQARQAALDKAEELSKTGLGTAEELSETGLETAEELSKTGLGTAEELSQTGLDAVEDAGEVVDGVGDKAVDVVEDATSTVLP
jgi:hypothetical protein